MDSFIFNPVTLKDVEEYSDSSNIFNMTKEDIESEKIVLASFEDERLGSSMEKLDVAVYYNGEWSILDIDDKVRGYNEIPLGYLLRGVPYEKVLVILRIMSTMLTDKVKSNVITYMYYSVSEKYRDIQYNKALFGKLAKNRVCLDDSEEMHKSLHGLGISKDVLDLSH